MNEYLECNDLTLSGGCDGNMIIGLENNNTSTSKDALLDLPEGSELIDQNGNVVAEVGGGVEKCRIRVPKR